jgi:GMP synthase (glutamine-hydrolysing)
MNYPVPVLGFCLGHEIIAVAYGGRIKRCPEPQSKKQKVIITQPDDPIFEGLATNEVMLIEKHHHFVSVLPKDFVSLGHSLNCENEIIRHAKKPIYSFQSHPEVSGKEGLIMVKNFLKMCKLI